MTEANESRTVNRWIASKERLVAELDHTKAVAEQKTRRVADQVAGNLAVAAFRSFFALAIGRVVTALAGSLGARRALFHESAQTALA